MIEGVGVGMSSGVGEISVDIPIGEKALQAASAASDVEKPERARNSFLLILFFMQPV